MLVKERATCATCAVLSPREKATPEAVVFLGRKVKLDMIKESKESITHFASVDSSSYPQNRISQLENNFSCCTYDFLALFCDLAVIYIEIHP